MTSVGVAARKQPQSALSVSGGEEEVERGRLSGDPDRAIPDSI